MIASVLAYGAGVGAIVGVGVGVEAGVGVGANFGAGVVALVCAGVGAGPGVGVGAGRRNWGVGARNRETKLGDVFEREDGERIAKMSEELPSKTKAHHRTGCEKPAL